MGGAGYYPLFQDFYVIGGRKGIEEYTDEIVRTDPDLKFETVRTSETPPGVKRDRGGILSDSIFIAKIESQLYY